MREEGIALEDRVDGPSLGCQVGDVDAVDPDRPPVGPFKAANHAQRGRLAATRGPEQREELPGTDLEVDALHGDDVVVVLLEFGDYDVPAT